MSSRDVFNWDYAVGHRWVLTRGWTHNLTHDALPMYSKGDPSIQYRLGQAVKAEMMLDLDKETD